MKIAFRYVPFCAEQICELNMLAAQGGYETVWYENGALPTAEEAAAEHACLHAESAQPCMEVCRHLPLCLRQQD